MYILVWSKIAVTYYNSLEMAKMVRDSIREIDTVTDLKLYIQVSDRLTEIN